MEINYYLVSSLLLSFIICVAFLKRSANTDDQQRRRSNLPPGPKKLPVIGNLHQLFGSMPHRRLRQLAAAYGPIMHVQLGEVSAVIVSSPEMAKEVLKTHDLALASRPELLVSKIIGYESNHIAFCPYGDLWRQLRKICILELLSTKRVQSFESIRAEEVDDFISRISSSAGKTSINLSEMIYSMTNNITARSAFGKKSDHQDEFMDAIKKITKLAGGFDLPDIFPSYEFLHNLSGIKSKMIKLHRRVDELLDEIINEHRGKKKNGDDDVIGCTEDLVDVLLRVQQSGDLEVPITMNTIKAIILEMFAAGTDTSSAVVEWAMSELLNNPKTLHRAQSEIRQAFIGKSEIKESELHQLPYLKLVIKETLRLHPPIPLLLPRESRHKCNINGYDIPVKTKVIVNAWAIGRDPGRWIDPERFEPERFSESKVDFRGNHFEFVPFGGGRRICPGMFFGLANVELPLARLLFHFDWRLKNGGDLDMIEEFGATMRRLNNLHLIAIPYV